MRTGEEQAGSDAQIARNPPRLPRDERERYVMRLRARNEPHVGVIYAVQGQPGSPVKIGYTANDDVSFRLATLQTGNPHQLRVILRYRGTMREEKAIHRFLAADRLLGEWFQWSDRLDGFLKRLDANGLGEALLFLHATEPTPEAP